MGADGKRNSKQLIFLAVVAFHGAMVLLLLRATHEFQTPLRAVVEPLVFLLLQSREPRPVTTASPETPVNPKTPVRKQPQPTLVAPRSATVQPITPPSEAAPNIDWQREIELAAQNGSVNGEKERNYRNLAGISDAQLKWVRDNHMVRMAPGMVWTRPRVEIDQATLIPIVHINDHCVLSIENTSCGNPVVDLSNNLCGPARTWSRWGWRGMQSWMRYLHVRWELLYRLSVADNNGGPPQINPCQSIFDAWEATHPEDYLENPDHPTIKTISQLAAFLRGNGNVYARFNNLIGFVGFHVGASRRCSCRFEFANSRDLRQRPPTH